MKILWKYSERYVVKQSASDKTVWRDPPWQVMNLTLLRLCIDSKS